MAGRVPRLAVALILILFVACLVPASLSWGQEVPLPPDAEESGPSGSGGGLSPVGNLFERVLAAPLDLLYLALTKMGFEPYERLVYGDALGQGGSVLSKITDDEWNRLMEWYSKIRNGTFLMCMLVIAWTGLRLAGSGGNPKARAEAVQGIWNWLWAVALILFAPVMVGLIIGFNDALTELFASLADAQNRQFGLDFGSIQTESVLAFAFVKLGFMGLTIYLNFLYVIRKFVLVTLLVFTPVMAWLWAFNRSPQVMGIWLGEILSNAFMQSSHALVLTLFLLLVAPTQSGAWGFSLWWVQIIGMMALIPTSAMLRNIVQGFTRFLGVHEERWAGLAMAGLGALGGIMTLGRASVGGLRFVPGGRPGGGGFAGGPAGGGFGGGPSAGGGPSVAGHLAAGTAAAATAGRVLGAVGRVAGAATGLPLASVDRGAVETGARLGGGVAETVSGMASRPVGTATSIVRTAREGMRRYGYGAGDALRYATGRIPRQLALGERPEGAARETWRSAGELGGAVFGSVLGESGGRAGAYVGGRAGAAARRAVDAFRWDRFLS